MRGDSADARRVERGSLSSVGLQANNQRGYGAPNKTANRQSTTTAHAATMKITELVIDVGTFGRPCDNV